MLVKKNFKSIFLEIQFITKLNQLRKNEALVTVFMAHCIIDEFLSDRLWAPLLYIKRKTVVK